MATPDCLDLVGLKWPRDITKMACIGHNLQSINSKVAGYVANQAMVICVSDLASIMEDDL